MISRDEAIKIIADYEINGCGYCHQGGEEVEEAFAMAIEALKAQEPRMMTLEEVAAVGPIWEYDTPPYLWLDINPSLKNVTGHWCAWCDIRDLLEGRNVTYTAENYGIGWRCWTARPDKATREATPWKT